MGLQELFIERAIKSVDFQALLKDLIKKVDVKQLIAELQKDLHEWLDGFKDDADENGVQDLDQAKASLALIAAEGMNLVHLVQTIQAKKKGK